MAKIIPIFKSGDRHLFCNYRPISCLSQFSKILENLFLNRMDHFIEKYKLINEEQYGFRAGRSTSMAVMQFTDNITSAIDSKKYTVGVFVDLKEAFNTIIKYS